MSDMFHPRLCWRNAHLQTITRGLLKISPKIPWHRVHLQTDHGDYLSLDSLTPVGPIQARLLVLHGLTGCSGASPIAELALELAQHGVETWALNLRGADRVRPTVPRLYHAGCTDDLEAVFRQLPQDLPWRFVGFSLGANLLLKWLGEEGGKRIPGARAMAVSCPYDLAQCSANLEKTWITRCYRFVLVERLKTIVRDFLKGHPGTLDPASLRECRTFFDFDENITAPLHGFAGAHDYWARNSLASLL